MKNLIRTSLLQKATEELVKYEMQKKEDEAFIELQKFMEEFAVGLKKKGIKEVNGQNYTLSIT